MRVLFCNIAWMEKYQGIDGDIPQGGGSYVTENNNAAERHNYNVYKLEGAEDLDDGDYCLGFVETMSHNGKPNQLHVEKISGCEMVVKEPYVDGVTVIFCARYPHYVDTYMVGWYKNARVYRNYVDVGTAFFNILAKSEDCVFFHK